MKNTIWIISFLALFQASTLAMEELKISNLSMQLKNEIGSLEVEGFNIKSTPLSLELQNFQQGFTLSKSELSLELPGLSLDYELNTEGVLNKISYIEAQNISLDYVSKKRLNLSTTGLAFGSNESIQNIPDLKVSCEVEQSDEKVLITDVLNPCLKKAVIDIPVLNLDQLSAKAIFKSIVNKSNKRFNKLDRIKLLITDNNFTLSLFAKYLFRFQVRVYGHIKFIEKSNIFDIEIKTAKAGFFSIKSVVINALKKADIEGVQVISDHIIIKI